MKRSSGSFSKINSSTAALSDEDLFCSHSETTSVKKLTFRLYWGEKREKLLQTSKKKTAEGKLEWIHQFVVNMRKYLFVMLRLLKVPLLGSEAKMDIAYRFSFTADCIDSCEHDRCVQLAASTGTRRGETFGSDWSPSRRVGLITQDGGFSRAPLPPN